MQPPCMWAISNTVGFPISPVSENIEAVPMQILHVAKGKNRGNSDEPSILVETRTNVCQLILIYPASIILWLTMQGYTIFVAAFLTLV